MQEPAGEPNTGTSHTAAADRRRDRLAGLLLVAIVASVFLTTANYTLAQNIDTQAAAVAAWSLGVRGTVVLPDDWSEEAVAWSVVPEDGGLRVNRFPGVIAFGAPFFSAAHLLQGRPEPPAHPYLVDFRPAAVAAVTATTLGVLCSYLLFLRLVPRRLAFLSALFLAFGTSVWSISGSALWTHGITHLFLTLGVLLLASDRPAAAGAALGYSVFTRPQTAMVPLVLGVGRAWRRRSLRDLLAVGIPSALGLAALVAYSWTQFANPLPTSGYGSYAVDRLADPVSWRVPVGLWHTLFDQTRGLLLYAPFLLALLPGLVPAWRRAPDWVRSAAVAGLAYQLFQLQVNEFSGGIFFFAYRLPLEWLVLSAPLLVMAFQEWVPGRRIRQITFAIGALASIAIQVIGVTVRSTEAIAAEWLYFRVVRACLDPALQCTVGEVLP